MMRILFSGILVLFVVGLYGQTLRELDKKAFVRPASFNVEIPVDGYPDKMVIRNVKVNGSKRGYNFILDTGCAVILTITGAMALWSFIQNLAFK